MKELTQGLSVQKLLRLYDLKITIAEKQLNDKKVEIAATRAELIERQTTVDCLSEQVKEVFMGINASGENIDTNELQLAHRHRYWLDYERQRQAFYLSLTEGECDEQLKELKILQDVLAKLNAKTDVLKKHLLKAKTRTRVSQNRVMLEEYESGISSRRIR